MTGKFIPCFTYRIEGPAKDLKTVMAHCESDGVMKKKYEAGILAILVLRSRAMPWTLLKRVGLRINGETHAEIMARIERTDG